MAQTAVPAVVLIIGLIGIMVFANGFRLIDTVGLLMSGALAGAALAALAAARRRKR